MFVKKISGFLFAALILTTVFARVAKAADFDGDGIDDFVTWTPNTGTWHILTSSTNFAPSKAISQKWGAGGDIPLAISINGGKKADFVLWRPYDLTLYALTNTGGFRFIGPTDPAWGTAGPKAGDIPMVMDVDRDGKADFVLYRPITSTFTALTASSSFTKVVIIPWGSLGDIPIGAQLQR